jgi:hypothetical protein
MKIQAFWEVLDFMTLKLMVHPALVLRPFVLRLACLQRVFICAHSFFYLTPFGWLRSITVTPYF